MEADVNTFLKESFSFEVRSTSELNRVASGTGEMNIHWLVTGFKTGQVLNLSITYNYYW